jgi:ferredoxin
MRIVYDKNKCKLHAQCRGAAPELFSFAPDGSLVVLDENPPEEQPQSSSRLPPMAAWWF